MVDLTWSLSGVDMLRWELQSASMWRPPVSVRQDVLEVPGQHGVAVTGRPPVYDAPTVVLTVAPQAYTQGELEQAVNELHAMLSGPITLGRESGGLITSAPAQLVAITPDEFTTGIEALIEVSLAVPGVFFRQTAAITTPETIVVSGTTYDLVGLEVGDAPITDTVLRVKGPLGSVQVTDTVYGTGLTWQTAAPLAATDYLYLNAATLRAWVSTSATAWAQPTVTTPCSYTAGGPLQLWPRMAATDPADRAVQVKVTGSGFSASTALAARARPSYF